MLLRYLAGATSARLGDEMSGPALLLAGLATTGSAASASMLLAAIMVAAAVGGPAFGLMLDRTRTPARTLALALAAYASALGVVTLGLGHIGIGWLVTIAVAGGLFGPALAGGWTAQLPAVVKPARLPRASALDAMTYSVSGLAGPAAAGVMAITLGARSAVTLAIILIAAALPWAWRLPTRGPEVGAASDAPVPAPPAPRLLDGLRAIRDRPSLARATAASVVSAAGEGMLVTCAPLIGVAALGGAGRGTVLLSIVSVAALASNAVIARAPSAFPPDRLMWASPLAVAAGVLVIICAAAEFSGPVSLAMACAGFIIVGAAEGPQLAALFAIRHRESPARQRAQVFATGASLKTSAMAIGTAVAGSLATRTLIAALIVAAIVQVAACSCTVLGRRRPVRTAGV